MTARPRWSVLGSLGLLALLCAVPLALGWDAPPEKKVRVSVVVILASEKDAKVCKRLECIAREVTKMHHNLKGFRMGEMACESLRVGVPHVFDLPEGKKTTITIRKPADDAGRVCLEVGAPKMGKIVYSTPCGKFLPILTTHRTKAGETVLIAIRVQPCGGK